ncbi:siderophore ABC transporter substrate-binding protein [Salipiger thiooxidans]|uniref:siderophore ABC transporter substrate-binding protein n=1 Tax=Salipiger thiooxidans TaxID=282683 RepID=UPI001CD6E494|nr:siderophore ABC transporter substrate-binding protein [Salipiger thiooxidans]MCA0851308.1 siderophore ABC transporter substrate-binding protein [Salipiger thiooxidans]
MRFPDLSAARILPQILMTTLMVSSASAQAQDAAPFEPMTITHALGETVLDHRPERIAALGMNDLDFLDSLGVPVAGIPKDFVPHFLSNYAEDSEVKDLGFIVKPDVEKVYELRPDLVLMSPLQAEHYQDISSFAPVVYFDVDYRNSEAGHLDAVIEHYLTLGKIFGKEEAARAGVAALQDKIAKLRDEIDGRPETALILLHNNGAFSSFGLRSRYGFVFSEFGVTPANDTAETGLHGQPVTNEFIQASDPDILFIIDRTAVMEGRPVLSKDQIANPLLKDTKAWAQDRVLFVDPEAWYVTAAGPTSLSIMLQDVRAAFER